ncbi:MAG: enoyl-CoA hydratase/isomerase family protein [Eubacteriales bacterium]
MAFQNILVSEDNGLGIITINRPEVRNALDPQTFAEIREAARQLRADNGIRVVVITGAGGKAFASGADIRTLRERSMLDALITESTEVLNFLENLNKPVIAAVDGFALGGGCELAMACDIRIATEKSKFGQPEVNLGIIPGNGGTQRLVRYVGLGKAKELIFTGEVITAREAKEMGLVNHVVPDEKSLMEKVKELAGKMMNKGPVAISLSKASINTGMNTDINTGLLFERYAQTIAFGTEDRIEGTTAFLEKRPANFKGR